MSVVFGALAASLREQLPELYVLSHNTCAHFQRDVDAITRLLVRGVASEQEGRRMRQRLIKAIRETLR